MEKGLANSDLEKIILTYWPQINFRVRGSLGHANCEWEDVAADVLVDAIEAFKKGKFRGESSAGTFIYVITSRRIFDYLRKKYRKPRFHREQDWTDSPFSQVKKKEEALITRKAIKKLKPRHADVLYLYYFMELTQTEIADIFGLKIRRVNELLRQARNSLKKIIKGSHITKAIP